MSDRDGLVTVFLRGLVPYLRQTSGLLVAGSAAAIVFNLATVLPAICLGRALDAVVRWQAGAADARAAGRAIAAWAGVVLLVELPRIARRLLLGMANNRMRTQLRADAMRGILGWPLARLHGAATGDLMARVIGDVEVAGTGLKELTTNTWDTLLSAAVILATLLAYNPQLTVLALAPVPAAMLLAHWTRRWIAGRTAAARESNAALTTALEEQLVGARLLRLLGRTEGAVERVRVLANRQRRANVAVVRLREGLAPVYGVLMTAGVVVVVTRGGGAVTAGTTTLGAFVAYLQLFLRFAMRGSRVPRYINRLQSAAAAWERLASLLAPAVPPAGLRSSFATDRVEAGLETVMVPPPALRSGAVALELRDVTFRYPGAPRPALAGVSFDVPAGSFLAVTGPVGSGKSALARVVAGLYPPEAGELRWDGVPLDRIPPAERARRRGYLPQDAGLFSGTVRENILLAWPDDADGSHDVTPFAERAALTEDLATLPLGLDTTIGETGIRISGGQRQRVALARALAAALPGTPGLLVLDDPFSAVDAETEARIIRTLIAHHGRAASPEHRVTLMLLSHRLAAFPLADRVVVLGAGGVAESGTHAALMAAGGVYARIFSAQSAVAGRRPG